MATSNAHNEDQPHFFALFTRANSLQKYFVYLHGSVERIGALSGTIHRAGASAQDTLLDLARALEHLEVDGPGVIRVQLL